VRGDRPQPAACRRSALRRPTHPGTGIDATPQDCHRPGPAGSTPAPTDLAPARPLALVETLACTMAQHGWTSAATACDTLTTRRQAQPQRTGKAGQTSRYPMPTTRKTASTNPTPLNSAPSVGWPGGIAPPGSHRSRRDSLPSPGSCRPGHQTHETEGVHIQCANMRGYRTVIPRQHSMAFLSARNRLYFLRIQRTR
jgi:hypothetical protein